MDESYRDTIESAEDIPEVESAEELNEKTEQVEELRETGEGWFDACLTVADNDAQRYVLIHLMARRVRKERAD